MFLAEPPSTAYDFRFRILGYSVRVSPFFWVAAVVLGWDQAQGMNGWNNVWLEGATAAGDSQLVGIFETNPGSGVLLLIWVAAVFVSILIHELGHAAAMRYFGTHSYIVLYHFGGLAIPDKAANFVGFGGFAKPQQQIVISAAGPAAQLAVAGILIAGLQLSGSSIFYPIPFFEAFMPVRRGNPLPSIPLQAAVYFLMLPSIFWALLNLLPVYPLDGGQIARELFTLFSPRDGIRNSLILSVAAGAGVAIYGLTHNDFFLTILFGLLAYSSYQILQAYSGRGGGFGGGSW